MNKVVIKKIDNNKFIVSLEVPLEDKWYDDVFFNCFNSNNHYSFKLNHKENKEGSIIFENDIELPDSALYNTFINCKVDGEDFYLDKDNNLKKSIDKIDMKKISVNFNVPDWCKNAMIYHIFVDRFYRSDTDKLIPKSRKSIHIDLTEEPLIGPDNNGIWTNDFYGGDLKGITEKLNYIKSLGISIIYLSPIVESQSNHRYDTADYLKVDPYAGRMEDLKLLCDKAHELGIKIILDAVFNHTGNDSIYFNEYNSYDSIGAFHNRDSYYSKFYQKENNNFKYWWGFKNLPECDCNSKEWQEFICGNNGVIDNWFKMGIDGLRLDVADELSDHFIKLIRKACNRNKSDSFIYGEVWEQPIYKNRNYIMSGHAMHSIMNYRGMDALIRYYNYTDIDKLNNVISMILSEYPKETRDSLMNSLSTHDISRIITILGCPNLFNQNSRWAWDLNSYIDNEFIKKFKLTEEEYKLAKEKYLSYLLSMSFLPGNLTLFYGDEAGLQGLGNLQNRRYFPWHNIDEEIELLVKNIGKAKNNNRFLKDAELKVININNKYFMYERYNNLDKLLVCTSRTSKEVPINVPEEYKTKVLSLKKSTNSLLSPYGGIVMKNN